MKLTETERIEILMMIGYGDRVRTQQEVCHLFNEKYPDRVPIMQSTVSKIEQKFRQLGHVRDAPKLGRPRINQDKELDLLLSVQEDCHAETNNLAGNLDIAKASVLNILHRNQYHPYKMQVVQELSDGDFDRRLEFCERLQNMCNNDPYLVKNIVFSDESTFYLNGNVNTQNYRYWSDTNPHWIREGHTQCQQKINVWA